VEIKGAKNEMSVNKYAHSWMVCLQLKHILVIYLFIYVVKPF